MLGQIALGIQPRQRNLHCAYAGMPEVVPYQLALLARIQLRETLGDINLGNVAPRAR